MTAFSRFVQCAGCDQSFVVTNPRAGRAKWCSERCRKRAMYGGRCVDCGAVTDGGDGPGRAPARCKRCAWDRVLERQEERAALRRVEIERLWAAGSTAREISVRLGLNWVQPATEIAKMRGRGYDLPHRRSPEQIARITGGSNERLAKARAVREAMMSA